MSQPAAADVVPFLDTLKEFLNIGKFPATRYQIWRRKAADPRGWVIYQIVNWGGKEMFGKPLNGYLTLAPAGYDKNPPLLRSFPGGGLDPNLKSEAKQVGGVFKTKEEAVKSIRGDLDSFFRPPLARFVLIGGYKKDGLAGFNPKIQRIHEAKP